MTQPDSGPVRDDIKVDFTIFLSGLMAEGLMALGVIKNPLTKEKHKDLRHASMVIDTMGMLREKTKGNLDGEESQSLDQALHQLRLLYVQQLNTGSGTGGQPENNAEGKAQA